MTKLFVFILLVMRFVVFWYTHSPDLAPILHASIMHFESTENYNGETYDSVNYF